MTPSSSARHEDVSSGTRVGRCVTFTIPGRLPSLNDVIKYNRANRQMGSRLKREQDEAVGWAIKTARLPRLNGPVKVSITWYEATMKRDPDNVFSGVKFILDALVSAGILEDDSQKHIAGISHMIAINREDPRIVVTLEEA